jgi:two-component system, response regulator PdtaR
MERTGSPLRIAVADHQAARLQSLSEMLARLGHEVHPAQQGRHLVELCRTVSPGVVITTVEMPDLDGISAAAEVCRSAPIPVIGVFDRHDPVLFKRALAGPMLAWLVHPVEPVVLEYTVALSVRLFNQVQSLRQEVAELQQALEDRKLIERAKGIVAKRLELDEEEAFLRMRRLASTKNHKLVEVARQVLATDQVFQALEGSEGGDASSPAKREARARGRAGRCLRRTPAREENGRPTGAPAN